MGKHELRATTALGREALEAVELVEGPLAVLLGQGDLHHPAEGGPEIASLEELHLEAGELAGVEVPVGVDHGALEVLAGNGHDLVPGLPEALQVRALVDQPGQVPELRRPRIRRVGDE